MTGLLHIQDVSMGWGERVISRDLNFEVQRGEILVIMGTSGCGKSTLMRLLVGLERPIKGHVFFEDSDLHQGEPQALDVLRRHFGVMFQGGALWSSMTVGENLLLPLRLFSQLSTAAMRQVAEFKLALVGLQGSYDAMPATLSGGMIKRVAIARSLVLNPDVLCLDEPASGLDPVNAARLDELILALREHLGTTVILVTHSVEGIFAVADRALYLDDQLKTMTAIDTPQALLAHGPERVREFLQRTPHKS
ncbi:ABC transporter ATP-binding protein [Rhodoferax antarcticus]|nr:ATP-binding cassette domain-containing protein [Rhodoferax antarcticus]APW46066.1 polyamine ABC transporter ATP-binding protein [Rhodoferax antarcticus]MCW2310362.1 phospholipid/cholesterol/gamma-HCH transport system ATP-binding protein [Rhodoferax antarcticus]